MTSVTAKVHSFGLGVSDVIAVEKESEPLGPGFRSWQVCAGGTYRKYYYYYKMLLDHIEPSQIFCWMIPNKSFLWL